MTDKEIKTIEAMEQFGGSFVRALAVAFRNADRKNFITLKKAFPDYWKCYEEFKLYE